MSLAVLYCGPGRYKFNSNPDLVSLIGLYFIQIVMLASQNIKIVMMTPNSQN